MGIRDKELRQLEFYAKGLGIKVTWRKSKWNSPGATWSQSASGPEIEMFVHPGQSKKQQVLNYLHELSHHVAFVYNGREDKAELLDALHKENEGHEMTKAERKLIYECEKADARYRLIIAHELGLKISTKDIQLDIDLDCYIYKYFYLHGHYPTYKKIKAKKRKLKSGN